MEFDEPRIAENPTVLILGTCAAYSQSRDGANGAGGTGRIGSAIARRLLGGPLFNDKDFHVVILTRNLAKAHKLFPPDESDVQILVGNLNDKNAISNIFNQCKPDIIIFAAGYRLSGIVGLFSGPTQREGDLNAFENLASFLRETGRDVPIVFLSYMWITWKLSPLKLAFGKVHHRLAAENSLRKSGHKNIVIRSARAIDAHNADLDIEFGYGNDVFDAKGSTTISIQHLAEVCVAAMEYLLKTPQHDVHITMEVRNMAVAAGSPPGLSIATSEAWSDLFSERASKPYLVKNYIG